MKINLLKMTNADITPLDKLSFIGKRGMGALEFQPEYAREQKAQKIDMKSLADLAERIYTEREQARIMPDENLLHYRLCRVCIILRSFFTIRFVIQRAGAAPTFGKIFKALVDLLQE